MKIHNEHKSHKCNKCDYASTEASNLRRHQKTHEEELEDVVEEVSDEDHVEEVNDEVHVEELAKLPFDQFVSGLLTNFPPKHVPQEKWVPKMDGRMGWTKRAILFLYHPDKIDKSKYGEKYHNLCEFINKKLNSKMNPIDE